MLKYLSVYVMAIAAAAGICYMAPTPVSAVLGPNLVQNPGFESGDFRHWTLSGNNDYYTYVAPPGYSGNYSAHLGARGEYNHPKNNHLTQKLSHLVEEGVYVVSFWLENISSEPNPHPAAATNQFDLLLDNTLLQASHNVPDSWFTYYYYNFTATAASHSLKIRFNTRNNPNYFLLDDVSVQLDYY